jgi:hypothetical protein
MKCMKMKFVKEHSCLGYRIGIYVPMSFLINRDAPRPSVAPFSESEPNGMEDDEFKPDKIRFPPVGKSDEDEVMTDLASRR